MYLADYHLHSTCSPDARDSMEDMIGAARAAGLDEICFTEHVEPLVWATTQPRGDYDWEPLSAAFAAAKEAAGDSIRVRLGIELGDAPWNFAWCETMLERAPELDFVIGSIHTFSPAIGCDLFRFSPADEVEARAAMADYLGQVKKLARWGRFQVLGHLTLPLRYLNELRGFHLTFDGFEREIQEILRIVIDQGKGIEVNANRGNTPLPDEKWLRMYRALGGEIITLGSDAHRARDVGCAIREGQDLLRRCGFRRFCTFDRGTPIWHDL